jgi:amidase
MVSDIAFDVLTADVKTLQVLLQKGNLNSLALVESYLAQIQRHDAYLHAMIQIRPLELLKNTARGLDQERQAGNLRGPLHGIPIIIKVEDTYPLRETSLTGVG